MREKTIDRLHFNVGPYVYTLVVSDRTIYDRSGDVLYGLAIESPRLILLSDAMAPEERLPIALHELAHCWEFHCPAPRDAEERAQFLPMVAIQFFKDIESQGGIESLMRMKAVFTPWAGQRLGEKEWLSTSFAAERLGMTAAAIRRRIRSGELSAVDVGNGRRPAYRVLRRDLVRFITERWVATRSAASAINKFNDIGDRIRKVG